MNFYDLIAKYKYICNKQLEENREDSNELTLEINEANRYISYLNSQHHISPFISGCAGVSLLFGSMFVYLFETLVWLPMAISGIIFSAIGCHQEKKIEELKKHKQEWYKYYTSLNSELTKVKIEEKHIRAMLKDVETCCNYYMYLLSEEEQKRPITIDLEDVLDSNCLLSTFLDEFYQGNLEDFLKLPNCDKKVKERLNKIQRRINQVKTNINDEKTERNIHRRRHPSSEEQPTQQVLKYQTTTPKKVHI